MSEEDKAWHKEIAHRQQDWPRRLPVRLIAYMFHALAAATAAADAVITREDMGAKVRTMIEELIEVHQIMTRDTCPSAPGLSMEEDFRNWASDLLESPWERGEFKGEGWQGEISLWEKPPAKDKAA